MLNQRDINDFYIEISLRAKNNFGNWLTKDQARDKIGQAIIQIIEEEKEENQRTLFASSKYQTLLKEMLEDIKS